MLLLLGGNGGDTLPTIREDHLPGILIERNDIFVGGGLWGYINGGADLYFEYGFNRVRAQKLKLNDRLYSIDVYQMSDPEAAYGIFSISHFQCSDRPDLFTCQSPYQLQLVQGPYYFSIVNENGSPEEREISKKLAAILMGQVKTRQYSPPEFFYSELCRPSMYQLMHIRGRLGLENRLPSWSQDFEGLEGYTITLAPFIRQDGKGHVALIHFTEKSHPGIFLGRNNLIEIEKDALYRSENHKKIVKMLASDLFLFIEVSEGTIFADHVLQCLE
jgi:hypothetical protein